ncbi:SPFH domain-containing protein [Thiotrichales bacterium HSG14]|nr:SPFH domain-containing protein [Thiotrichales bacterium HSG14]
MIKETTDAQPAPEISLSVTIYQDLRQASQIFVKGLKKLWIFIFLCVFIYLTWNSIVFTPKSGYIYSYDKLWYDQKIKVFGWILKKPWSQETAYKQLLVIDFGNGLTGESDYQHEEPMDFHFNDNFQVKIPVTFFYKLPNEKECSLKENSSQGKNSKSPDNCPSGEKSYLEKIHKDFPRENVINALLLPLSHNAIVNAAMQYKGGGECLFEEGGLEKFRKELEKQLLGKYPKDMIQTDCPKKNSKETTNNSQKTSIQKIIDNDNLSSFKKDSKEDSLSNYGITLIRVTLGTPIPEPELAQRLIKSRLDKDKKADKKDEWDNAEETSNKEMKLQLTKIKNEIEIQEKQFEKENKILEAQKAKELAIITKENEILEVQKDKESAIAKKEQEILKAQKDNDLVLAQKQLKIVKAEQEIHKAKKEGELSIAVAIAEAKTKEKLNAAKTNLDIQKDIAKAKRQAELNAAKINRDIQKANLEAKRQEELNAALKNKEIQKANFKAAEFEAQAILAKGKAEAEVLKAKYEARIPDIYRAEIQKEIAQIIYPNLKGIELTMPRNIVNLGEQGNNLQTNLDVLSSFATIGVMEGLEKKALESNKMLEDNMVDHQIVPNP